MQFYLLGRLRIVAPGETAAPDLPRLRKAQGLLAYLLLYRGQRHTRDQLATLFWGDVSEDRARDSLSTALKIIRALLPATGAVLNTDRFAVQLDLGHAWLDVAALESGLVPGTPPAQQLAALRLYTADLLEDWHEDWCIPERERLRQRVLDTGTALIRSYLHTRQWEVGIELAQHLLAHDPLDVTLHNLLIQLLLATGQRDAARRHYEAHAEVLEAAQDSPLRAVDLPTASSPPAGLPEGAAAPRGPVQLAFAGRGTERAMLQAALADLRAGQGGLVLISGMAGMGKTRLIEEALAGLQGVRTLRSAAYEFDREIPFGPLARLLAGWLIDILAPAQVLQRLGPATAAALVPVLPGLTARLPGLRPLAPLPPAEAQAQLIGAVGAAVLALGAPSGGPAVLVLDDLHLSDPQTPQVLGHIQPRLTGAQLLILAAYRPDDLAAAAPVARALAELTRAGVPTLTPAPLTPVEVQAIVEPRQPLAGSRLSHWLYTQSGGNPFYLAELLRSLHDAGLVAPDSALGGWYQTGPPLPTTTLPLTDGVQKVVLARLGRLSPAAQAVLQVAAVAATETPVDQLVAVSGLDEAEALDGLESALARRFLQTQGGEDSYVIAHDLIRAAIYATLSAARRRFLHGRLAAALEPPNPDTAAPALITQLAYHYERTGNTAKQREYFRRAAAAAQAAYSYATAVDYYTRLLPLLTGPADLGDRLAVYANLGDVLRRQHRYDEAEAAYQALAALAAEHRNGPAQARAETGLGVVAAYRGDETRALAHYQQAERVARAGGPGVYDLLNQALLGQAWIYFHRGQVPGALALGQEALAHDAASGSDPTLRPSGLNLLGAAYEQLGLPQEADSYYQQALALFRTQGDHRNTLSLLINMGTAFTRRGDYAAALAAYQEAQELAQVTESEEGAILALAGTGQAYGGLGDYTAAARFLRQAIARSESAQPPFTLPEAYLVLAEALIAQDERSRALQALGRAYDLGYQAGNIRCIGIAWRILAAVLGDITGPLVFAGQSCDARWAFNESLRVVTTAHLPAEQARTLRAWAAYEQTHGDPARGSQLLATARSMLDWLGLPAELARTPDVPPQTKPG
jgi:DNA-binding SARP family transcriptional activator